MNRFKFIIKGILLWTTGFVTVFFISGIDSIYDNGYFFQTLIAVMTMCYACFKFVSKEEYKKIMFYNILNQYG